MRLLIIISSLLLCSQQVISQSDATGTSSSKRQNKRLASNEIVDFNAQESTRLNLRRGSKKKFSIYLAKDPDQHKMTKKCFGPDQYFTRDGRLGLKGKIVEKELTGRGLSTPMKHLFFRNTFPNMENLCPKFNKFNDREKLNFWIWYVAAIAATESTCGSHEYKGDDPQGLSAGEMQMPERKSAREWRDLIDGQPGGCVSREPKGTLTLRSGRKTKSEYYMGNTAHNIACGIETLAGVLCGFYRNPTERCKRTTNRPYGNGFWKQLRKSSGGTIAKDIKRLPICK